MEENEYYIYYEKLTGKVILEIDNTKEKDYEKLKIEDMWEYQKVFVIPFGKMWIVKDGSLQLVDNEEVMATKEYKEYYLKNQINEYRQYLISTDYIIVKLQEAQLTDENEYQELLTKYKDTLAQRKIAREKVTTLETELNSL